MRMEQDDISEPRVSIKVFSLYLYMFKECNHVNVAEFKGHGGSLLRMGTRCLLGGTVLLLGLSAVGALLLAVHVGIGLEGRLSGGAVRGLLLSGT